MQNAAAGWLMTTLAPDAREVARGPVLVFIDCRRTETPFSVPRTGWAER
jgi:hypothetical protein